MNLPSPTKGRKSQVLDCAHLAALAYKPEGNVKPFTAGHDHGFVAWNANAVVISIAGSDDAWDWLSNLHLGSFAKLPMQFGTMHGHFGIVSGAAAVAQQVKSIVPEEVMDRPLFITGHSRGGAIAHWLPEFFRWPSNVQVVSFGAPRCVRGHVRPSRIERWSYVLPGDPVPLMPLWSRGWRDPGVRIFLHEDQADDEWPTEWLWHIGHAITLGVTYALRRPLGRLAAIRAVNRSISKWHLMPQHIKRLESLTGVAA